MNAYVTGKMINELREKNNMTQLELANIINVSEKTISKWETSRGLPDISLIEPLAKALKVSIVELMNGEYITNKNVCANIIRSSIYVCPVCGNVVNSIGEGVVLCCGINLPVLSYEEEDEEHVIDIACIENEYYVSIKHEMSKKHYISFIAYITDSRFEYVKLYPQQDACARFMRSGKGIIYIYCNQDGLYRKKI